MVMVVRLMLFLENLLVICLVSLWVGVIMMVWGKWVCLWLGFSFMMIGSVKVSVLLVLVWVWLMRFLLVRVWGRFLV